MVQILNVIPPAEGFPQDQCWCRDCFVEVLNSYVRMFEYNTFLVLNGCPHVNTYANLFIAKGDFDDVIWTDHLHICSSNFVFNNIGIQ